MVIPTSTVIFWSTFFINWTIFIFELYLSWRQYQFHQRNKTLPSILPKFMSDEMYSKARLYQLDKDQFNFVMAVFKQLQITIFVFTGLMAWLWKFCGNVSTNEMLQSNFFFFIFLTVPGILNLPLNYYDTFVIEQKHGFNQQVPDFFFKDQAKKLLFEIVFALPTLTGIISLVHWGGEYFFFYLWIFVSTIILFTMMIYPEFVAPFFDKYLPFPEGQLKGKIETLAKTVKFPLAQLYVVQGSKRSSHSNAYMYGFGRNKRIVLFDTVFSEERIKKLFGDSEALRDDFSDPQKYDKIKAKDNCAKNGMTDDEIVAVIGHELGHWKNLHNIIHLVIAEINLFLTFYIFQFLHKNETFFEAFGFQERPIIIGFLLLTYLNWYQKFAGIFQTFINRQMEFSADLFSANLGFAENLSNALIKFEHNNYSLPINDPLYATFHHAHPSVPERIKALKKFA